MSRWRVLLPIGVWMGTTSYSKQNQLSKVPVNHCR
jgi:hypothetical protein